jgi:hypothetical protein
MTIFYCLTFETLPNLEGQVPVVTSPRNRVVRLYPQALGSLFVASYVSQGYGGGIRTRLLTAHGSWFSVYSLGTDRTENSFSIIACSLVSGETCLQSCFLATAVVLSPVTCQWVYISQYLPGCDPVYYVELLRDYTATDLRRLFS